MCSCRSAVFTEQPARRASSSRCALRTFKREAAFGYNTGHSRLLAAVDLRELRVTLTREPDSPPTPREFGFENSKTRNLAKFNDLGSQAGSSTTNIAGEIQGSALVVC